jgi:hypothetical protein
MEAVCWFTQNQPGLSSGACLSLDYRRGQRCGRSCRDPVCAGLPPGITEMRACACLPSLPICRWITAGEAKRTTMLLMECVSGVLLVSCVSGRATLERGSRTLSSKCVLVACPGSLSSSCILVATTCRACAESVLVVHSCSLSLVDCLRRACW